MAEKWRTDRNISPEGFRAALTDAADDMILDVERGWIPGDYDAVGDEILRRAGAALGLTDINADVLSDPTTQAAFGVLCQHVLDAVKEKYTPISRLH